MVEILILDGAKDRKGVLEPISYPVGCQNVGFPLMHLFLQDVPKADRQCSLGLPKREKSIRAGAAYPLCNGRCIVKATGTRFGFPGTRIPVNVDLVFPPGDQSESFLREKHGN